MNGIIDLCGMKAGTNHEKDYRPTGGVKTGANPHKKSFIGLRGTKTGTIHQKGL